MTIAHKGVSLILSNDLRPSGPVFSGYCFQDRDFIRGAKGFAAFESETGRQLSGGEDGSYLLVRPTAEGVRISADFWGFTKVFYHHAAPFWAASNSLAALVAHLNAVGRGPLPNLPVLRAAVQPDMVFHQMFCNLTIAHGIALLPAGCDLEIGPARAVVTRHPRPDRPDTYVQALSDGIETWTSRAETLLSQQGTSLNVALTGGRDSRTTFALIRRGAARLGVAPAAVNVHCGAIRGDPRDLEIASLICAGLGMAINAPARHAQVAMPAAASVEACLDLCLGVYSPLYLPQVMPDPNETFWGGGGAGAYRPAFVAPPARRWFWQGQAEARFVDAAVSAVNDRRLADELRGLMRDAIAQAAATGADHEDPLILYYRHFRHRCHAGVNAQYRSEIMPLASQFVEDASRVAGRDRLRSGQIIFDILHNAGPDLLEYPFETAAKAPSPQVRANLCPAALRPAPNPGRCFIDTDAPVAGASSRSRKAILTDLLARARGNRVARLAFDDSVCQQAEAVLHDLPPNGKFRHASEAIPVAAVLAAALFV